MRLEQVALVTVGVAAVAVRAGGSAVGAGGSSCSWGKCCRRGRSQ